MSWAADGLADGSGTGALLGQTVTYSAAPAPNAGTSLALDWNTAPGTNDAVGTSVSSQTAVRVTGTFGPGNPLTFVFYNYSGASHATMAFTVGVTDAPPRVTIASPADGARFGLLGCCSSGRESTVLLRRRHRRRDLFGDG